MAQSNIYFDTNLKDGAELRRALTDLESGRDRIKREFEKMTQMATGDGQSDDQFNENVRNYGFRDDAQEPPVSTANNQGRLARNEIQALDIALDGIKATLDQAFAKFA